jgi:hypothetical protein
MKIVVGVLVVAAVATAGDAIWHTFGVRHTIPAGVVHGALLLTVVGASSRDRERRVLKGLPIGAPPVSEGRQLLRAGRPGGPAHLRVGYSGGGSLWLILAALEGRCCAPAWRPGRPLPGEAPPPSAGGLHLG